MRAEFGCAIGTTFLLISGCTIKIGGSPGGCDTDEEFDLVTSTCIPVTTDTDGEVVEGMLDEFTCLRSASERCFKTPSGTSWPAGYDYNDSQSTYACEDDPAEWPFRLSEAGFVAPYFDPSTLTALNGLVRRRH